MRSGRLRPSLHPPPDSTAAPASAEPRFSRGGCADPLPQRGRAGSVGTQMGKLGQIAVLSRWVTAEHPKEISQAVKVSRIKSAKNLQPPVFRLEDLPLLQLLGKGQGGQGPVLVTVEPKSLRWDPTALSPLRVYSCRVKPTQQFRKKKETSFVSPKYPCH